MITLIQTDATHADFAPLIKLLDAELAVRDGDEHDFYDQFNKIDQIKYAIIAYEDEVSVGCGAIKHFNQNTMEVKRMFTPLAHRGKGIASTILIALEAWATELGYAKTILETGIRQPEAIGLYKKLGYKIIPNYGQYIGMENSVCFEKMLAKDHLNNNL